MVIMIMAMLVPLWVAIYTWSFGRWLKRRGSGYAFPAYLLAVLSLATSSAAIWRVLT